MNQSQPSQNNQPIPEWLSHAEQAIRSLNQLPPEAEWSHDPEMNMAAAVQSAMDHSNPHPSSKDALSSMSPQISPEFQKAFDHI